MNKSTPMLEQQIEEAAMRIDVRKQLIACRVAQIGVQFRRALGSRYTLLGSVAVGFLTQRLMRLLSTRKTVPARPGVKAGLVASLGGLLSFMRMVLTSWPAILFRKLVDGLRPSPAASTATPIVPRAPVTPGPTPYP